MCHRSDGELPPLVTEDVHHQEDQHADDVLASVEPALHHLDAAQDGSKQHEADVCGIVFDIIQGHKKILSRVVYRRPINRGVWPGQRRDGETPSRSR